MTNRKLVSRLRGNDGLGGYLCVQLDVSDSTPPCSSGINVRGLCEKHQGSLFQLPHRDGGYTDPKHPQQKNREWFPEFHAFFIAQLGTYSALPIVPGTESGTSFRKVPIIAIVTLQLFHIVKKHKDSTANK
jgi:hypothetical protein